MLQTKDRKQKAASSFYKAEERGAAEQVYSLYDWIHNLDNIHRFTSADASYSICQRATLDRKVPHLMSDVMIFLRYQGYHPNQQSNTTEAAFGVRIKPVQLVMFLSPYQLSLLLFFNMNMLYLC